MDDKLRQFIINQLYDYIFTLGIEDFSDCLISAFKEKGTVEVCVDKNDTSIKVMYAIKRKGV